MKLSRIVVIVLGSLLVAGVAGAQIPGAPAAGTGSISFALFETVETGGEPAVYIPFPGFTVQSGYVVLKQTATAPDTARANWSDVVVFRSGQAGQLPQAGVQANAGILISGLSETGGISNSDLTPAGANVTVAAVQAGPVVYILEPDQIAPAPYVATAAAPDTVRYRFYSNVPNLNFMGMLALAGLLGIGGIVLLRRGRALGARPTA